MRELYTVLNLFAKNIADQISNTLFKDQYHQKRERSLSLIPHISTNLNQDLQTQNLPKMQMFTNNNNAKTSNLLNRWMMISFFMLSAFMVNLKAFAQPSNYIFAGSSGTYTPVTGTDIGFLSATFDDGYTGNIPIGFTFNYNGVGQTIFAVSPNGWIQPGKADSSSSGFFTNALVSNANFIAPLWDDNNITGGTVKYATTGTSPNRILTVQWTGLHVAGSGSTTNPTIDMQVVLHETSGVIDFNYGPQSAALSSPTASIGISGNVGNYLSVTPAAIPANSTSSNSSEFSVTSSANFPSGTIYTFTPPPPCTAPANPPTGIASTTITISSIAGSFTASTGSPAASGYLVVMYPNLAAATNPVDGTTYTAGNSLGLGTVVGVGVGTTFTATGLSNATTYDFYIYSYKNTLCAGIAYNTTVVLNQNKASYSTNTPGTIISKSTGGSWSDPNTWIGGVVPTINDNVIIGDVTSPNKVSLDATNPSINKLTVGQTTGILEFNGSGNTLTVTQSVTVAAGGILRSSAGGAVTTNALIVGTDMVNDGAVDFSTNGNTAGVNLQFNNATNNTFSGSGTTNLRQLTINKGTTANRFSPYLEITLANAPTILASVGVNTSTWNGLLKISGTNTWSSVLIGGTGYTIPSTGGLWLNNPNFTVLGQNGSPTLAGFLRISNGTFNIGTATGNSMALNSTSTVWVEGGFVNATGRLGVTAANTANTYIQSAGVVTVGTIGHASTTLASFDLGTSTSAKDTLTGGTIIIQLPSTAASGPRDYRGTSLTNTTSSITGGTIQFGNAATLAAKTYFITGLAPNLTVDNSFNHGITLQASSTINGTFTKAGTGTLNLNGVTLTFKGPISNAATSVISAAASSVVFQGTLLQTLNGSITGGIGSVTVNNPGGAVITPSVAVNTSLTLTAGSFSSGGTLTLGAGAATGFAFAESNGSLTGTIARNYGSGTNTWSYLTSTSGQAIGNELTGTIAAGTLIINNTTSGVTLGSALTIPALTLTAGKLTTTGTNLLTISGSTPGSVVGGSTTSYVNGPLVRTLISPTTSTYTFPIGKSAYQLFEMITPTLTGAGTAVVRVEAFDAAPGSPANFSGYTVNPRYWQVSPVVLTGAAVFTATGNVRLTETGLTAVTQMEQSVNATETGTYTSVGGTVVTGTPGTITNVAALAAYGTVANSTYFVTGIPGAFPPGVYSIGPNPVYTPPSGPAYVGNYATLTAAFAAINPIGFSTANVVLELQNDYVSTTETYPLTSTFQGTSTAGLTIRPRSDASVAAVISGNIANPLFDLKSKYLVIDGRLGGTGAGKFITINNTNAAGSAVRFINDAQNNSVQYTTLQGVNNTATGGIVVFSTTTGTTTGVSGNTNNLIDNNDIDGGGTAANAIYSAGTATFTNRNNTISNNNIFNYFAAAIASNGILISANSSDWTISNNKFYQSGARTQTVSALHSAITVAIGNNHIITGNTIGFANNAGTGVYTLTGVSNTFRGINLAVGTTTATTVSGNTIAGISQTTAASGITSNAPFMGIYVSAGLTTVNNNTIGSQSATGSITYTCSSGSASDVNGIFNFGSSAWTVNGNNIGGITANSTSPIPSGTNIYPIAVNTLSSVAFTCQNNLVGGTIANSIQVTSFNNTNMINGILSISPASNITGNTVRNLTDNGGTNGGALASVIGISVTASSSNHTVSQNIISNLNNTSTGQRSIIGLNFGSSTGTNLIQRNNIHSLGTTTASTNSNSSLTGINITGGTASYQNNFVAIGIGNTSAASAIGINETAGTNAISFNTVYLGGTDNGTNNDYALLSVVTGNTRSYRDNILFNERSNTGGGKSYAIALGGTGTNPAGLTTNYNLLTVGAGGFTGLYATADQATLANWQSATGQDANSITGVPCFVNNTTNPPDLHLTNCGNLGNVAEGAGIAIASIPNDYDADVRASFTPTDIGADAGDFASTGIDVGITALVNPTAISCHSANENVIVTLKNFSGTDVDFTVHPVTIHVSVTGPNPATVPNFVISTGSLVHLTSQNFTVGTINTVGNGAYSFTAYTTANDEDINIHNDTIRPTVTIAYVPLGVTAVAGTPTICQTGSSSLTATPVGGTTPYTYLWSGGTTTTSANNNTGTISVTTTYTITVTDFCTATAQNTVTVNVNNPTIGSPVPGSHCGPGTVSLSATAGGGGTARWYATNTSTTSLFSGVPFITPVLSAPSTTYFVSSEIGAGPANAILGTTTDPTASVNTATTNPAPYSNYYGGEKHQMLIRASELTALGFSAGVITSVSFTVNEVGSSFVGTLAGFQIDMKQTTSTTLNGTSFESGMTTPATTVFGPVSQVIPTTGLPAQVTHTLTTPFAWDGFSNIVIQTSFSNGNFGTSTDYVLMPNVDPGFSSTNWLRQDSQTPATILAGTTPTSSSNARPNIVLNINSSCASARIPVVASITATSPITVSPNTAFCAGTTGPTLTVTSPNDPNYTYTWTPSGTVSPSTGASVVATPASTTTYTVNAVDATTGNSFSGCTNTGTVVVTVNPAVSAVTAVAAPTSICAGATVNLSTVRPSSTILTEGFEAPTVPVGWTIVNAGQGDDWNVYTGTGVPHTGTNALGVPFEETSTFPTNAWAITPGLNLTANVTYSLSFWYTNDGGTTYVEKLKVTMGNAATVAAQNAGTELYNNPSITGGYHNQVVTFTPTTTGTYYIGFNGYSAADQDFLGIDDILLTAGITESFAWSSAQSAFTSTSQNTTDIPTALSTTYDLKVSNQFGCFAIGSTAPVLINTIDISVPVPTAVSCFNGSNGELAATGSGGGGSYTYTISGPTNNTGQTSGHFTGLVAGFYTITVSDGTCSKTSTSVEVTQPASAVTVAITGSTPPTCYNTTNGTISAQASGGTPGPGYTYTISGPTNVTGATSGTFTGLSAGVDYVITAIDNNSCNAVSSTVNLTAPAAPSISATNSSITAPPVCAGSDATLDATAGFSSYSWSGPIGVTINNSGLQTATAVAPPNSSTFTVTATDANGCVVTAPTTVTTTPTVTPSVTITANPGVQVCDGTSVTFTAHPLNGGTTPSYAWLLDGSPAPGATNSATYTSSTLVDANTISVVMTSNAVCATTTEVTSNELTMVITGQVPVSVTLTPSANPTCAGTSITFTAVPTGGGLTPSYQFFVGTDVVQTGSTATYTYVPVDGDVVSVILTSSAGDCATNNPTQPETVTMQVNPIPATPTITPASGPSLTFCDGGSVLLTSSPASSYVWSLNGAPIVPAQTGQTLTATVGGNYTVTVTELNCPSLPSAPVLVTVNPNPVVNITGTLSFCTGSSTILTANVTAGGPATTYTWTLVGTGTVGGNTPTLSVNVAGDYTVTASNGNCTTTSGQVTVSQNPSPTVVIDPACLILTPGQTTTLHATASGVTYSWSLNGGPSFSTNATITTGINANGTYTVTVTDAVNFCTASASVVVNNLSGPLAGGTYAIPSNTCGGFTSIANAVTYINNNGVAGNVIFNVAGAYTENAPVGGINLGSATLNPTLTTSQRVTFQKSGAGANPKIIAPVGTVALPSTTTVDAIFTFNGTDYVTMDGIDLQDNNASGAAMMEYGYVFFKPSAADGNQNNTIKNCVVTLNKTNNTSAGSRGIALTNATRGAIGTSLVITTAAGRNDNNTIAGNTVQNCFVPIIVTGFADATSPYTFLDQNNTIGGTSAPLGNILQNFGTGAGTTVGISAGNQNNALVQFNTISNAAGGGTAHGGTLVGISVGATSVTTNATINIRNNTLTLAQGNVASQVQGIAAGEVGGTGTLNISDNTLTGFTNVATTGGLLFGIVTFDAAGATVNITNNAFSNNTVSGLLMINLQATVTAATVNITGNTMTNTTVTSNSAPNMISSNTGALITGAFNINNNTIDGLTFTVANSQAIPLINPAAAASTVAYSASGNEFKNINFNVASTASITFFAYAAASTSSGLALSRAYNNNKFTNLSLATSGAVTFFGDITSLPATGSETVNGNQISGTFAKTVANGAVVVRGTNSSTSTGATMSFINNNFSNITLSGTSTFVGLSNTDGGAPTKTVTGNTFNNITITGGTSASSISAINCTFIGGPSTFSNNTITNLTTSGTITGMTVGSGSATSVDISNNTVTNLTSNGVGNTVIGITTSTPATVATMNTNIVNTLSSTSGSVTGITSSATNITASGNTVNGLSSAGVSSTITGMAVTGGTKAIITGNNVNTLTSTGTTSPTVNGMAVSSGTSVTLNGNNIRTLTAAGTTAPVVNGVAISGGTTVIVRKNKIYDLSETASPSSATTGVNGILVGSGTTDSIYNNTIGDLKAAVSNQADAIRGISITSTSSSTTINVDYNTININASSTGANFGTNGLFHTSSATATTAKLDMRNNIIVNTSTPGSAGFTAVIRRSGNNVLGNFAPASNNNYLYAGTPGTRRLIYADGSTSNQTLADYKTAVNPREIDAVTEDPATRWVSTVGSDPLFLHIKTNVPTLIESGAGAIPTIATDYDGDIRFGSAGYTGLSTTKPDIGADEFDGQSPACVGANGGIINNNNVPLCTSNTVTTITSAGATSGAGISYQWQVSSTAGGPYAAVTGGTGATTVSYTTPNTLTAGTYYYVLNVTCSADPQNPVSQISNEVTVTVTQTPSVTANPVAPLCVGQTLTLTGVAGVTPVGTTYAWTGPNSYTGSGLNPATVPNISLAGAGIYSLIATNGACASTAATVSVIVNALPTTTAVASPTTLCAGAQLNLTSTPSDNLGYTVASIPVSPETPSGSPVVLANGGTAIVSPVRGGNSLDDGYWDAIALPFSFTFYGTSYSTVRIGTNGNVQFGPVSAVTGANPGNSSYTPQTIPTAGGYLDNFIGGAWMDQDVSTSPFGTIRYFVNGVAPNRKFVISYELAHVFNSSDNNTSQIILNENGTADVLLLGGGLVATTAKAIGVENADGTLGTAAPGRNAGTWTTAADEAWRFSPPVAPIWEYSWTGPLFTSTVQNPVIASTVVGNSGTYNLVVKNDVTGCSSTSVSTAAVTVNPRPLGVISGGAGYCPGQVTTTNLTVTVSGATGPFSGTLSDGTAFGPGTSPFTVVVTPSSTTTYTIATLTIVGGCASIPADLSGSATVTLNPPAADPTASVVQPTCALGTGTINVTSPLGAGYTYSIGGPFQSSTSFPGQNPGTYTLSVHSPSGCASTNTASVVVNPQPFTPAAPTVTGTTNVCPFIGTGTQLTYTASAAGATTYNWTIPPTNVTIVSGQGTANLVVTFNNGYAAQANQQIRVTAQSVCGTSPMTIFYTLTQLPNTPGTMTGPTNVCALIGTTNTATYIIPKVAGAASYLWAVPNNATFTHTYSGINDTVIVVTYGPGFTGGNITVRAVNDCGTSSVRSYTIGFAPPAQPGLISGPTFVCPYKAPTGTPATYSIVSVPFATSYTWTTPPGSVVTHPNGTGANDNTITVLFPASFTNGSISVTATNGCGTGLARTYALNSANPGTPSNIDVIQTHFCGDPGGRVFTYTLSGMPANATSVAWTIPSAGATLVSGQGSTSITVSYSDAAILGTVTAQGINGCGGSSIRTVNVKLPACPVGFAGGNNTDNSTAQTKGGTVPATRKGMEVRIFPNPTVSDFKMEVLTSAKEEINVRVLDDQGRLFKTFKLMPYQSIALGAELRAGSYLIEVRQGTEVKTTKVLKF